MSKVVLYILLASFILLEWGCKKISPDPLLSEKFERTILENTTDYVSLDTVMSNFEWNWMLVKMPYNSFSTIRRLDSRISNLTQLDLSENDHIEGLLYLIFVLEDKAVAYCKITQSPCCSFYGTNSTNPIVFPKDKAVFRIEKKMYGTKIQYNLWPKYAFSLPM